MTSGADDGIDKLQALVLQAKKPLDRAAAEAGSTARDRKSIDLTGIVARGTDLSFTTIEQVQFERADLGGSNFQQAEAGEANFRGAMLEDASFVGARLRYANLRATVLDAADFSKADLWGACLVDADADDVLFCGARCDEVDFTNSNLTGADFTDASLKKSNLSNTSLRGAVFTGSILDGARLDGANLADAGLSRVNLWTCSLKNVYLAGAWLENTRLRAEQLGGSVGEEIAGQYQAAYQAYVLLEGNFRSLGNGEDASWAFRKSKRMKKLCAREAAKQSWALRRLGPTFRESLSFASDVFVEWLCDYGESLGRVVRAFITSIFLFAIVYDVTGTLQVTNAVVDGVSHRDHSLVDNFIYSF